MNKSIELTQLLAQWRSGDASAERELMREIYPLLRGLAHQQLNRADEFTLQSTDLAHEAYLKLLSQRRVDWANRGHFFAIAGRIVRRVVIDYLRERKAQKRGAGQQHISLDAMSDAETPHAASGTDWLHLEAVLQELEAVDPEGGQLVEQRYFAGLSVAQIAEASGVSEATVARRWRAVRAWLEVRLTDPAE